MNTVYNNEQTVFFIKAFIFVSKSSDRVISEIKS